MTLFALKQLAVVDAGEFESPIGRVQLMIIYIVLHCIEPFIITLSSSRYDLNDVDRDVKHQIINSSLYTLLHIKPLLKKSLV